MKLENLYKSLRTAQAALNVVSTDLSPEGEKRYSELRRKVRKLKSLIISLENR